jgi:single-strand DNA-binding protein
MGNLTRDPELKTFGDDKKVCNFGIAVNRKFKRGKETVKETSFLDMECWDAGAEMVEKYFKKGDPIIVHCSVKTDTWDSPEGEKRSKLKFRVDKFDFVPGSNRNKPEREAAAAAPATSEPQADADGGDGDIPF